MRPCVPMLLLAALLLVAGAVPAREAGRGPVVYAASTGGRVFALAAADGSEVWTVDLDGILLGSPVLAGDRLYVASAEPVRDGRPPRDHAGRVFALSAATGEVLWSTGLSASAEHGPLVLRGRVLAGAVDGSLHCLDAASGRALWRRALGSRPAAAPAACGDRVVVATADGTLRALAIASGEVLWEASPAAMTPTLPVVRGDTVFVAYRQLPGRPLAGGLLCAIEAETGRLRWSFSGAGPVTAAPVAGPGTVFVLSLDTHAYALDASTGALRWKCGIGAAEYTCHTGYSCRPVLHEGVLHVLGADDDGLVRLSAETGERLGATPLPGKSSGIAALGDLLVAGTYSLTCHPRPSAPGSLVAIEAGSGGVRWRRDLPRDGFLGVPVLAPR